MCGQCSRVTGPQASFSPLVFGNCTTGHPTRPRIQFSFVVAVLVGSSLKQLLRSSIKGPCRSLQWDHTSLQWGQKLPTVGTIHPYSGDCRSLRWAPKSLQSEVPMEIFTSSEPGSSHCVAKKYFLQLNCVFCKFLSKRSQICPKV